MRVEGQKEAKSLVLIVKTVTGEKMPSGQKNRIRSDDIVQARIGKSYEIGYDNNIVYWERNKMKKTIESIIKDKNLE